MADYIPRTNMYEGIAEQTLSRRAGTPSPWAALAQVAGGLVNQWGQQRLDARVAATQQQGKEKIAEIGAQKARDVADIRGDSSFMNTHTQATDEMIQKNPKLKQIGAQAGEYYPNRFFLPDAPKSSGGAGSSQFRPNDKQQALLNKAAEEHRLPPDYLSRRGNLEQYVRKLEENPNFDFVKLGTDVAGQKTEAASQGSVRGKQGSLTSATGKTIDDLFNELEPLVKKNSPYSLRIANEAKQKVGQVMNKPDATQQESLITELRGLVAAQLELNGKPGVVAKKESEKMIPSGMNAEALAAAKKAVMNVGASRAKNLQSAGSSGGKVNFIQPKSVEEHAAAIFGGQ